MPEQSSACVVRTATDEDGAALARLDRLTWSTASSPAPPPPADRPFFGFRLDPSDVLVAELDGAVVGWAQLGHESPLVSHAHVLELQGLGVDPRVRGRGIGRTLVAAAVGEARRRGMREIRLRVLATNPWALAVYRSCRFEQEGCFRGEFVLDGAEVDDLVLARRLV